MDKVLTRVGRMLPGFWLGFLICIALVAAPAAFATLQRADAARVVAWLFAHEAPSSLVMGALMVMVARRVGPAAPVDRVRFGADLALPLGAVFCTVAGYYGLQPMMVQAREGAGAWTFGQLHAVSLGLFGLKILLVAALAWRKA